MGDAADDYYDSIMRQRDEWEPPDGEDEEMSDAKCNCAAHGSGVLLEHWPTCAWVLDIVRQQRVLATAMVLAVHHGLDVGPIMRDGLSREHYWLALPELTRQLMIARAEALIEIQDEIG